MSDPNDGREVIIISDAPQVDVLGVPVPPGYTNHIGSGRDPAGNIFWAVTVDGPNSGDVDVAIMRRDVTTGVWEKIWTWDERTYGKHGYGTLQPLPNGSLSCGLAERNAAGQTVAIERIVPAANARVVWNVPSSGGGGLVYVDAPNGYIRVVSTPPPSGTPLTIALPASIPTSARKLDLRLCVSAPTAGARGRVGANATSSGAAMLTVVAPVAHIRAYGEGQRPPGAGHTLIVWADNGPLAELFVDVMGWWY